jgi:PAS domain-containing protein
VSAAVEDRGARAVMLGILAFARESGSFVIAEGIETEAMLELARDPDPDGEARPVGAQGAQGFLLGRPAAASAEAPSYQATLATLTELTAERERRRIAQTLQRGDDLYRVLIESVPDLVVALFDRDLRCQLIEGGIEAVPQWREMLHQRTFADATEVREAARLEALLRPALDGESTAFRWPLPDGAELEVSAAPVRDRLAGVIGVMTVARRVVPERARTRGAGAAVRL